MIRRPWIGASAVLVTAVFTIGCDGQSALAPDVVTSVASPGAPAGQAPRTPIDGAGVVCPSDAPQLRVGSLGLRMDIDFSEVSGATAYEIQIDYHDGRSIQERFAHLEIPAPAHYAAWYGFTGRFFVKIRTINCGGVGNWSGLISHTLTDGAVEPPPSQPPSPPPPPPPPPKKKKCTGKC